LSNPVIIGDCTLYCGDSKDIISQIDNVDAVVTDPPYGMNFVSNHRKEKYEKIHNDDGYELLRWAASIEAKHSSYVFCRWDNLYQVNKPNSLITWVKNNWSMGDLQHEHARQTEVCLFYKGANHYFPNKRPTDVIFCKRTGNEFHPTEKPLQLIIAVVEWTNGVVIDPFMGSGTTGVACAKRGRKFIGVELDQKYFDIACQRIEKAYQQPDLFVDYTQPEQEVMEL
jgi:site-specific DNA-methyltransferase (adenine-specific)